MTHVSIDFFENFEKERKMDPSMKSAIREYFSTHSSPVTANTLARKIGRHRNHVRMELRSDAYRVVEYHTVGCGKSSGNLWMGMK